ncbi:MAG: hypothetical protein ABI855_10840, partial [Bacteroidota bacterium]
PDSNLDMFKKLMRALNAQVSIMKNSEEKQKKIMLKLIEESEKSENVSKEEAKKYFRKYGVDL